MIIFQPFIPGIQFSEGECYFFNGFQSYLNDFPLLWNLLSPEGITENRALALLSANRSPRIPAKAAQAIAEPLKYRYRDQIQEELRTLGSILLEEIEDDPNLKNQFYQNCYVTLDANNRHLLLSKQVIESRYKRISENGVTAEPIDIEAIGTGHFPQSSKPIVVVGDVGVGKSSFFEALELGISGGEAADTCIIKIDLGKKANLTSDLKSYVIDFIHDMLRRKYDIDIDANDFATSIYHKELEQFQRSVKGQLRTVDEVGYLKARIEFLSNLIDKRDNHLHASLGHLVLGRKMSVIVILDNADQRHFDFQQQAFLIAQELAAHRTCSVFVALRPSTFYLSKTVGSLSAYQNRVLTISPPPPDEVVILRLTFALKVAEGKIAPGALQRIRLNLPNIVAFLRAMLRAVRQNEEIKKFIGNISGGNIRAVIELITGFCGSPNVDARKIIQIEETTKGYNVPIHEFSKHALLGEYAYYNALSSVYAFNVFDIIEADPREHFLASLIVALLLSNLGIRDNDGFVAGDAIVNEMTKFGFVESQIQAKIRNLATKRLIETPYSHFRELSVEAHIKPSQFLFRATTIGAYHIKYWIGSFSFLDATSTDTPIFNEEVRESVWSHAGSFEIRARFKKASAFRKYLLDEWHKANFSCAYFSFPDVVSHQEPTFASVEKAIRRGPR